MGRINRIKDIVGIKEVAVAEVDVRGVLKANKSLNNIIKDNIKKAQQVLGENNRYKEYVTNNRGLIREQLAINKEVYTIQEAMSLINNIDLRYILGLDVLMEKTFNCEFIIEEQRISFAFKTAREANEAVEREIEKYPEKEITISAYERFGMYVRELVIKGGETQAWISYSHRNSINKYLYIIGNKDKDNYFVTHTLDLLDLYQIFMCCDFKEALKELCELLDVRIKEFEEIRDKYNRCKNFVSKNLNKDKFPALYELICKHISKLEAVLNIAIDKLYYHKQINNKWVFSSSMDYLAEGMEKAKSTINHVINTFALLGLVQKTDSNDGKYSNWDRNEITWFYIVEYNKELFEKAEQLAKIMLFSGERITVSTFSYANCSVKFGGETANLIFKDKVTKAKAS